MYKVFSSRLKMCYPTLVDVLKKKISVKLLLLWFASIVSYPTVREGRKSVTSSLFSENRNVLGR